MRLSHQSAFIELKRVILHSLDIFNDGGGSVHDESSSLGVPRMRRIRIQFYTQLWKISLFTKSATGFE